MFCRVEWMWLNNDRSEKRDSNTMNQKKKSEREKTTE
jgi:hypothetical protein